MKIFDRQEFHGLYDQDTAAVYSDLEFRRCRFLGSALSITRDPRLRSTARNIRLLACEQRGCSIKAAILDEILVDGLKTNGLLQTWGAVFKHVTLRGRIGRLMISPRIATGMAQAEEQRAFDDANAAYYETVDWALDIREAEFEEFDLRGLPARLVVRDPETQVVVTREKAMSGTWQQAGLSSRHWAAYIKGMLHDGERDVVLAAPRSSRKFRDLVDDLARLRDAGIAEPG